MEVDADIMSKFDYVRVKIGCRDVTKVLAVVNGMIDFLFYDFKFQREVIQDGTTNPAGNKWVRNDRAGDGNPSPKKKKTVEYQNLRTITDQNNA